MGEAEPDIESPEIADGDDRPIQNEASESMEVDFGTIDEIPEHPSADAGDTSSDVRELRFEKKSPHDEFDFYADLKKSSRLAEALKGQNLIDERDGARSALDAMQSSLEVHEAMEMEDSRDVERARELLHENYGDTPYTTTLYTEHLPAERINDVNDLLEAGKHEDLDQSAEFDNAEEELHEIDNDVPDITDDREE